MERETMQEFVLQQKKTDVYKRQVIQKCGVDRFSVRALGDNPEYKGKRRILTC